MLSIKTYEDYLDALKQTPTEMFWWVPDDVEIDKNFTFDIYFSFDNHYDRYINHMFLNDKFYDGIVLFSKHKPITKKEFDHRFLIERKEWNMVASHPKPFDIIFISYNEPNADENYEKLLARFPRAKRVHGVKGIHQAHIEAAKLADSYMFWVVDGDAVIIDDFKFDFEYIPHYNVVSRRILSKIVHVWKSRNPINDLEYGYGGVKLLPKDLTINMDVNKVDMTTSISDQFKSMPDVSNVTVFNTDPFNTWKSAFRECVKLASGSIDRQENEETEQRLERWCSDYGKDKPFGEFAVLGARSGKQFGIENSGDETMLKLINDFDWLKKRFETSVG